MIVEYDGTNFVGWQIQKKDRSVQGVLENALSKRFGKQIPVVGSGRTDAGVHALGQTAHFDVSDSEDIPKLRKSFASMLPDDIILHELSEVSDDFHARFSAKFRTYKYQILTAPSAVSRLYCWYIKDKLDVNDMHLSLRSLIGDHIFEPLAKANPEEKHYKCNVTDAKSEKIGDIIYFRIRANRFVHGMVRAITGTLVDVGRGKKSTDIFKEILESSDRDLVSNYAPPHGLFLEKVEY
ncbi:tRNA pseudouridine(38-40) synthase TruA [candidate division KSB1 bacterium]